MTRFESPVKSIPHPPSRVYGMLSDFDNFESLLPGDKVKSWESQGDSCRFEVEGVGQIGLKIIDREEPKTIKYTADGKVPFSFFLWVQLKEVEQGKSKMKLTLDAELNPMIKMVAQGPLKKFLGILADAIAEHEY